MYKSFLSYCFLLLIITIASADVNQDEVEKVYLDVLASNDVVGVIKKHGDGKFGRGVDRVFDSVEKVVHGYDDTKNIDKGLKSNAVIYPKVQGTIDDLNQKVIGMGWGSGLFDIGKLGNWNPVTAFVSAYTRYTKIIIKFAEENMEQIERLISILPHTSRQKHFFIIMLEVFIRLKDVYSKPIEALMTAFVKFDLDNSGQGGATLDFMLMLSTVFKDISGTATKQLKSVFDMVNKLRKEEPPNPEVIKSEIEKKINKLKSMTEIEHLRAEGYRECLNGLKKTAYDDIRNISLAVVLDDVRKLAKNSTNTLTIVTSNIKKVFLIRTYELANNVIGVMESKAIDNLVENYEKFNATKIKNSILNFFSNLKVILKQVLIKMLRSAYLMVKRTVADSVFNSANRLIEDSIGGVFADLKIEYNLWEDKYGKICSDKKVASGQVNVTSSKS